MNEPRNPSGFLRQHRHLKQRAPDWFEYERRKAEYVAAHPDVTPTAYEAEMQRIAKEINI